MLSAVPVPCMPRALRRSLASRKSIFSPPRRSFSAFGAAAADVIRTRVMSCQYVMPADPAVINQRLDAIEKEMAATMTGEGFKSNQVEFRRYLHLRYRRQTAGVEMPGSFDRFNAKRMTEMHISVREEIPRALRRRRGLCQGGHRDQRDPRRRRR